MKRTWALALALALALSLTAIQAQADSPPIAVVGIAKDGRQTATPLSHEQYVQVLRGLTGTIHDSTLPTLNAQQKGASGWLLRDVVVGIGLSLEAGLGPIWSVSFSPRVRFGFSNSTHPKYPN